MQKVHFRLTSVAQQRCCLSSPMSLSQKKNVNEKNTWCTSSDCADWLKWHTSSWIKLMVDAGCIYVKLWNMICFGTRSYYHHGPCTERIHLIGRNHDQKRVTQKGKEEKRRNSFIYNNSFHLNILVGINFLTLKFKKLNKKQLLLTRLFECVPLRYFGLGSMIQDHSDHGRSNEPTNPCPEWIHRFIWSTMIRVISDHWSRSRSSQRSELLVFNWTLDLWHMKILIRTPSELY